MKEEKEHKKKEEKEHKGGKEGREGWEEWEALEILSDENIDGEEVGWVEGRYSYFFMYSTTARRDTRGAGTAI